MTNQKKWLIISYAHIEGEMASYGRLICSAEGSYEQVVDRSRKFTETRSPVVVCGVIEP